MKYKIVIFLIFFMTFFSVIWASQDIKTYSKSVIAMDADSAMVLYNKNMNNKVYPASTTKILTAILSIENLDLSKSVVVSKTALNIPWDSSSVYLKEGEVISVKDLLYCLLLNSGNDAANVLAEAVSGDIESFVKLMNTKLKELGCANTNFVNAHGYSHNQHYTTALDMAKIFSYCIKSQTIVNIISSKTYTVEATNKTSTKRLLKNTNRLILQKEDSIHARFYKYCIGGKTGYTDEAGRTLVTFAKKDNKTIIVAVFGAGSNGSQDARYTDAINLFEYSFNNFNKVTIAEAQNYIFNYININKKLNYTVGLKDNVEILSKSGYMPNMYYTINIDDKNLQNIDNKNINEIPVGNIAFVYDDENGNNYNITKPLYLMEVQKYNPIFNSNNFNIWIFVIIGFILFIIIFVIYICSRAKKNNKRIASSSMPSRKANRKNKKS